MGVLPWNGLACCRVSLDRINSGWLHPSLPCPAAENPNSPSLPPFRLCHSRRYKVSITLLLPVVRAAPAPDILVSLRADNSMMRRRRSREFQTPMSRAEREKYWALDRLPVPAH